MSRRARRPLALLLAAVVALGAAGGPALAAAPHQRASFNDVQQSLMCVACHEPLNVAQSPEAFSENQYVRGLIAKGETKQQILNTMVQQYGPAVLAKPPAHGFNVLVYVVPPVVVAAGLAIVLVTIPRWRRRTRSEEQRAPTAVAAVSDEDARRLDADMARHS